MAEVQMGALRNRIPARAVAMTVAGLNDHEIIWASPESACQSFLRVYFYAIRAVARKIASFRA